MKHLTHVLTLALLIILFTVPGLTEEPTQEATVEAAPVAIVGEGTSPSMTCEEGATCNLNEASDTSADPLNNTTEILGIAFVIALVILLAIALVFGRQIIGFLSKLVPPETAASIYESGVRFGYQVALNQAAQTTNTYDDEFLLTQARARGYTVTTMPDGTYHLEPPKFTTTSTAPIASESAATPGAAAFPNR